MSFIDCFEKLRRDNWRRAKTYDPSVEHIGGEGDDHHIRNMTDEEWEEIGKIISSNTHLRFLHFIRNALNDHKASFLFRGLTKSSSINRLDLGGNDGLSVVGLRSMEPFLQNANNLTHFYLRNTNIDSEGFNMLLQALRNSPIQRLNCSRCGIDSFQIESASFPTHLMHLNFNSNNIDIEGCRSLAELLQGDVSLQELDLGNNQLDNDGVEILFNALQENQTLTILDLSSNEINEVAAVAAALQSNATLKTLKLEENKINDDGVEMLADTLRSNTTLKSLDLRKNAISKRGLISLLKLVNDISSVKATLQSNDTLENLQLWYWHGYEKEEDEILNLIDSAVDINKKPARGGAGKEKVIKTQLHSATRAKRADLQGVTHSVYSEIDSLYLPEVLSLIGRGKSHGLKELFPVLKSTMTELLSKVDMKVCIQKQVARHEAEIIRHEEEAAYREARIRAMISEHESMMSEHESMISAHGAKIEKLNNRLKAMEDPDQNISLDTKAQSSKRRRVDGFFSALSGFWRGRFKY